MSINDIHFIREILVQDHLGNKSITLEVSYANASSVRPTFKAVPFYELDEVRALYAKLGGGRAEGAPRGSTVIIPNRSRWANLWGISADEVEVVGSDDEPQALRTELAQSARTRARNRLMRD